MICEHCGKELIDTGKVVSDDLIKDKDYIDILHTTFIEEKSKLFNALNESTEELKSEDVLKYLGTLYELEIKADYLTYLYNKSIKELSGLDLNQFKTMHIIRNKIYY